MDDKLPLSVLMLARDETEDLAVLLPALGFAREVVVVWDPRGATSTREVAERSGARVLERPFDGFGPQRQFALEQCREDWVLWIDPDERLDAEAVHAIRQAARPGAPAAAYTIARRGWFLGTPIRFCGWQGERVLRLFPRAGACFDAAAVHEQVQTPAPRVALAGRLEHHAYRTWDDCVAKLARYARAGAEQAWQSGRRASALDALLRAPLRFLRMYVLQLGVLDGAAGLVLCLLASAQVFLKYGELWQRGRAERTR